MVNVLKLSNHIMYNNNINMKHKEKREIPDQNVCPFVQQNVSESIRTYNIY